MIVIFISYIFTVQTFENNCNSEKQNHSIASMADRTTDRCTGRVMVKTFDNQHRRSKKKKSTDSTDTYAMNL